MSNGEINESTLFAYLNKELRNEEMIQVDLWLARSSENMQKFNEVRDVWKMTGKVKAKPVNVDTDKAWDNVLSQINTSSDEKTIQMTPPKNRMMVMIAASLALLVAASTVIFFINSEPGDLDGRLELNARNEVVNERLGDGTDVTLNENSTLKYPPTFEGGERRVELEGECFFDVARDEQKPFIIDLPHNGYVKVLGTSFNINAIEGSEQSEVYVSTGKVEFGSDEDKVILTAGEKAVMDNATGAIDKVTEDVHEAVEKYWIDQTLDFHYESMDEVVVILNQVYDDEVVIDCENLGSRQANAGPYVNSSLESILVVLSELHGFKIEPEETADGKVYHLTCDD